MDQNELRKNRAEVYFALRGSFNPDEVTLALGVHPTEISRKGNKGTYNANLGFSSWKLSSGQIRGESIDVYEMSERLVAQLAPKTRDISDLMRQLDLFATLQVVVTLSCVENQSTPALGFSQEVVRFLSEVGGQIDVDLYQ